MYINPEFYELLIRKAVYFDLIMKLYRETGYVNDTLFGCVTALVEEARKKADAAAEQAAAEEEPFGDA